MGRGCEIMEKRFFIDMSAASLAVQPIINPFSAFREKRERVWANFMRFFSFYVFVHYMVNWM